MNSNTRAHLRGLEAEFGESSNAVRIELNRFEGAGLLNSLREGNKKIYQANVRHPLYTEIHNIILKETGIDRVIEKVIHRLGDPVSIYLTGEFARGKEGKVIELIIVGSGIDLEYLGRKVNQAEDMVKRKILCHVMNPDEAELTLTNYRSSDLLQLWSSNRTD
ncbi:MAG: ArsR family transcriptional regulator [Bacteroidales bacterium]|nr:ArsR family transcriptional regulator [Bacteroidales bacterium]